MPIVATYGAGGTLESINPGEVVSIVPFRGAAMEYSFKLPEDTGAEKIKLMLWSGLTELKPIKNMREFVIK